MVKTNILEQLLQQTPEKSAAMAQRAQALQADATFWEPGEEIDKHTHLPLWHVICAFKGLNPAHWALSSPDQARTMQRHTTGDVSERLKEIVRLHDKAAGHAQAGGLKGFGDTAKSFKTTLQDLIEWATLVGEAPPAQCPATDAISGQSTPDDQSSDEKMSKQGLINAHKHHWPTIEADIDRAAKNGLATAKVGQRGWYEAKALKWARSNGKIAESRSPTSNNWATPLTRF